jgi:hypothetical protein
LSPDYYYPDIIAAPEPKNGLQMDFDPDLDLCFWIWPLRLEQVQER